MIGVKNHKSHTQVDEQRQIDEKIEDIHRAQSGDQRALNRFVQQNTGLVGDIAKQYRGKAEWNDLINAGLLGVAIAAKRFDITRGCRFSNYANWYIHNEIQILLGDIRGFNRNLSRNLNVIHEATRCLTIELGREPTLEELSEFTNFSQDRILRAWGKFYIAKASSLNQAFEESEHDWLESQADMKVDVWRFVENEEISNKLCELEKIGYLEHRQILIWIAKIHGYNNQQIGRQLGLWG